MAVKMINANKENGQVVEFSIDDDEVAAVLPSTPYHTDIILKSGHRMSVEVVYSDLMYLLFNK